MFKFCSRSHTMLMTDDDFMFLFLSLERKRKRLKISIEMNQCSILHQNQIGARHATRHTKKYCTITNHTRYHMESIVNECALSVCLSTVQCPSKTKQTINNLHDDQFHLHRRQRELRARVQYLIGVQCLLAIINLTLCRSTIITFNLPEQNNGHWTGVSKHHKSRFPSKYGQMVVFSFHLTSWVYEYLIGVCKSPRNLQ